MCVQCVLKGVFRDKDTSLEEKISLSKDAIVKELRQDGGQVLFYTSKSFPFPSPTIDAILDGVYLDKGLLEEFGDSIPYKIKRQYSYNFFDKGIIEEPWVVSILKNRFKHLDIDFESCVKVVPFAGRLVLGSASPELVSTRVQYQTPSIFLIRW
jgi:hypothetical protein